jgi:hypothetical protein
MRCCLTLVVHSHGYNWTDFMWDVDFMHPIDPGMAAISDLVVHLIQQTALGLLLNPLSRADKTLLKEELPGPMFPGGWRGTIGWVGYVGQGRGWGGGCGVEGG